MSRGWTGDERYILRSYWSSPGHDSSWRGWRDLLPERSPSAVYAMARRMGLMRSHGLTFAEDELLRRCASEHIYDPEPIARVLTNRSVEAIAARLEEIREEQGGFTKREDRALELTIERLANVLGRPQEAVWDELARLYDYRASQTRRGRLRTPEEV